MSDDTVEKFGRRVTSADVARESGVSRATVSYVLNNVSGRRISAATRQLVLDTASRLGHVPYAPARSLRSGRSNIVLALVRDFAIGYVSNTVLRRLDLTLAERGYVVLAHRYEASVRSVAELWGMVTPALVVAMGGLSVPERAVIDGTNTKLLRVHGIVPQELAGRRQAEYILDQGHRVLGYALPADPTLALVADERLAGARAVCDDFGSATLNVQTIDTSDPATVFAALDAWQHADPAVTAVCAHNDDVGLLIGAALAARGQRMGVDLAVIGIDDIPLARISLTTIRIDVEAWADVVVDSVLALLDDKPAPRPGGDFLRLIVRDSA